MVITERVPRADVLLLRIEPLGVYLNVLPLDIGEERVLLLVLLLSQRVFVCFFVVHVACFDRLERQRVSVFVHFGFDCFLLIRCRLFGCVCGVLCFGVRECFGVDVAISQREIAQTDIL